ncbi:alpha/beta fold hydrolase [Ostreiculturibacter nitratireducens]|uniref:alpha/beta fold hydrolase n=1 Tax=Ostreiculturibacter nitratireducens TaxID=3075226 RepID=UPI0031B56708
MARFLLVHGSCHGAWCWRDVVPILERAGHEARAIDLPGHGDDTTPAAEVTLDLYARAILAAIDEPVVLVGHSMAGYPITLAAQMAPEKIDRLVYLCAYVPKPGLSLADMRRAGPRQPLLPAIETAPDGVTFRFRPDMVGEKLYHDCPEGTVDFANAHLCPQPITPQATPIAELDRWNGVRKHYILCEDDQAIPPEYQAKMTQDWPEGTVTRLPTSHSPFFAAPAKLAERLMEIATT